MARLETRTIYDEMGVRPVINATGHATVLGGSRVSDRVKQAMEDANKQFVVMKELLERSGQIIAGILGAEAAYITSGCAGALTLSAAAVMTGKDLEKIRRLPRTTGMKNEIVIQKRHRYKYDRCLTITGAKLVEVGNQKGTTAEQLERAIGPRTAAVHYFYPWEPTPGPLPLQEVVRIAHSKGVPVIVDAAGQVFPLDHMRSFTRLGADLVCFGAKYFGGPHSAGVLCGKRELVESAALQGFIGFEETNSASFGRPMKVDRQEIVGTVVALQDWFSMNHEDRLMALDSRVRRLMAALQGLPTVKQLLPNPEKSPATGLRIFLDTRALGKDADALRAELRDGNPRIITRGWANDKESIYISVPTLDDSEVEVVARRLKELLR